MTDHVGTNLLVSDGEGGRTIATLDTSGSPQWPGFSHCP